MDRLSSQINEIQYTNNQIKDTINFILVSKELDGVDLKDANLKGMQIGDLMVNISNEALLDEVVEILKRRSVFSINSEYAKKIDAIAAKAAADGVDAVRVKSICYGIILKRDYYANYFDPKSSDLFDDIHSNSSPWAVLQGLKVYAFLDSKNNPKTKMIND